MLKCTLIESQKERAYVLAAADASNAESKVSKIYTVKDNVWGAVELLWRGRRASQAYLPGQWRLSITAWKISQKK